MTFALVITFVFRESVRPDERCGTNWKALPKEKVIDDATICIRVHFGSVYRPLQFVPGTSRRRAFIHFLFRSIVPSAFNRLKQLPLIVPTPCWHQTSFSIRNLLAMFLTHFHSKSNGGHELDCHNLTDARASVLRSSSNQWKSNWTWSI